MTVAIAPRIPRTIPIIFATFDVVFEPYDMIDSNVSFVDQKKENNHDLPTQNTLW